VTDPNFPVSDNIFVIRDGWALSPSINMAILCSFEPFSFLFTSESPFLRVIRLFTLYSTEKVKFLLNLLKF